MLLLQDGKYLSKKNTFTDFIACAKHLIKVRLHRAVGLGPLVW